jgi:hypothetical protein
MKSLFAIAILLVTSAHAEIPGDQFFTSRRGAHFEKSIIKFRPVLNGALYRSGSTNTKENSDGKRLPLQDSSLKNLCEAGFSQAVYLYPTAWDQASPVTKCEGNSLNYSKVIPTSSINLKSIFKQLKDIIVQQKGPMLVHCWYGLHQSGYVAATALMQFCGYKTEAAISYFDKTSEGVADNMRDKVGDFHRFEDINLSDSEKERVCP